MRVSPQRRLGSRLLGLALGALVLLAAAGCMGPQTPQGKADEAIREFNEATRWGRMDIALGVASSEHREQFMKNHASWHNSLRIVEAELAGLQLSDATHAKVQVDVSWTMSDDTTLRVTRLEQTWIDDEGKWTLTSEKRIAGAEGLFGEEIDRDEPKKDSHFPTRVIH